MNITLIRGDTKMLGFQRKDNDGNVILDKADKIYFTVKKSNLPTEFLLQKKIEDMEFDSEGTYHFKIEDTETESLPIGTYKYDIEAIVGEKKNTLVKGNVVVKKDSGKVINLKMTRGDTQLFSFQRKDKQGEVIALRADNVLFIVCSNSGEELFRKTIDDIEFDENGTYHIVIDPEDTDSLAFTSYKYTLKVISDGSSSTVASGSFKITEEVTFAENEE